MLDYRIDNNEILTITIPGDLSSTNASEIQSSIMQIIESKNVWQKQWHYIKIDLQNADIIDSLGINVLINVEKRVSSRPCEVEILIASSTIQQLLAYTHIDRKMKVTMGEPSSEQR